MNVYTFIVNTIVHCIWGHSGTLVRQAFLHNRVCQHRRRSRNTSFECEAFLRNVWLPSSIVAHGSISVRTSGNPWRRMPDNRFVCFKFLRFLTLYPANTNTKRTRQKKEDRRSYLSILHQPIFPWKQNTYFSVSTNAPMVPVWSAFK